MMKADSSFAGRHPHALAFTGVALAMLLAVPAFARGHHVAVDKAINCRDSGCLANGPGCNTTAVPGQCSYPKDRAVELCRQNAQCVALNCNTARSDCQARSNRKRTPWKGMNSIVVRPLTFTDEAVNCAASGCLARGPGCDTTAVPGQCSYPADRAVELCRENPDCVALNCNSARSDCQARSTRVHTPWKGMKSVIVDKD